MPHAASVRDACEDALERAFRRGAVYADVRATQTQHRYASASNGGTVRLSDRNAIAWVVRALVDGAWGAASTFDGSRSGVQDCADRAVACARAAALLQPGELSLAQRSPTTGRFQTTVAEDPFAADPYDFTQIVANALRATSVSGTLRELHVELATLRANIVFLSSTGDDVEQTLTRSGGGAHLLAASGERVQHMRVPQGPGGYVAGGGMEVLRNLGLPERIRAAADEADLQLLADPCPSGITTVVLDTRQVASQLHHTYGVALNADNLLATPPGALPFAASDVGSSVASGLVTVVADSGQANGLGSYAFDDEGSPGSEFDLVTDGTLTGWVASRVAAARLGWDGPTSARAAAINEVPATAVPNVSICPRPMGELEALIADIDNGIYMAGDHEHTASVDHREHWFTCEVARRIENGALTDRLYGPGYVGTTRGLWSSVEAVGNASTFQVWGHAMLRSPDSMLSGASHGAAPIRMRMIDVRGGGGDAA